MAALRREFGLPTGRCWTACRLLKSTVQCLPLRHSSTKNGNAGNTATDPVQPFDFSLSRETIPRRLHQLQTDLLEIRREHGQLWRLQEEGLGMDDEETREKIRTEPAYAQELKDELRCLYNSYSTLFDHWYTFNNRLNWLESDFRRLVERLEMYGAIRKEELQHRHSVWFGLNKKNPSEEAGAGAERRRDLLIEQARKQDIEIRGLKTSMSALSEAVRALEKEILVKTLGDVERSAETKTNQAGRASNDLYRRLNEDFGTLKDKFEALEEDHKATCSLNKDEFAKMEELSERMYRVYSIYRQEYSSLNWRVQKLEVSAMKLDGAADNLGDDVGNPNKTASNHEARN